MIVPTFRQRTKEMVYPAMIASILVVSTTILMPCLQASIRNNRVFLLGAISIAVLAFMVARYSLIAATLLSLVAGLIFFGQSESMGSAMYQVLCFGGLFVLALNTRRYWEGRIEWIYNAVCIVALMNVAAQVIQLCGVSFPRGLDPYGQYGYVGLLGNVNETSALLAVCLPFFFRKRWWWVIPVIVAGLFMARTTNGIIAASVVSVLWFARKTSFELASALCVFLLGVGVFYCTVIDPLDMQDQTSGRWFIYKTTARAATIKPFGWGYGQYDYVMPLLTHTGKLIERGGDDARAYIGFLYQSVADKRALDAVTVAVTGKTEAEDIIDYLRDPGNNTPSMFIQAHNEYLEAWFSMGYAGIILILAFLVQSLIRGFRKLDDIPAYGLLASALVAMFFFSWQIIPVAVVTVLCLALTNSKEGMA